MIEDLEKIASIQNIVDKKAFFMSLLTREAQKQNMRPIVVGGSAVDFYTEGIFSSYDIDLVGSRKIIGDILERYFDFKRSGRHWINEQIGIYVEVPGEDLAGDLNKVTTIKVNDLKLFVIGIEDLIIDRMAACSEWKSETDCKQAHYMLKYYHGKIDFNYLNSKAKDEGLLKTLKKLCV